VSKFVIDLPERALADLGQSEAEVEMELRLALAVQLYRTGKYSAGGASEAAGVPVTLFNARRGEFGLVFAYTPEELAAELELLEGLRDRP
jgi:predicted HTH domain antitoxin